MKTTISVTITENTDGSVEFYFINNDTGDTCKKICNFEKMDDISLLKAYICVIHSSIDSFCDEKERS